MLSLLVLVYLRSWKNGFTVNKWLRYFADQFDNFNLCARRILFCLMSLNILLFTRFTNDNILLNIIPQCHE